MIRKAQTGPPTHSSDRVGVAGERCLNRGPGGRDAFHDAEKLRQGARGADELRFDPIPVTAPRHGIRDARADSVQLRGAGPSQSQAKSLFGRIPSAEQLGEVDVVALERVDVGGERGDIAAGDRKARAPGEVATTDLGRGVQEIAGRVGRWFGYKSKRERGVQRVARSE